MKNIRIGDILIDKGIITSVQLNQALEYQKSDRTKRVGQILMELGFVTERQILHAMAERLNLTVVDLRNFEIAVSAVEEIPKKLAIKYQLIAIHSTPDVLTVALNDPLDFYAIEDIKLVVNRPIAIVLALKEDINSNIDKYYSEIDTKKAATAANMDAGAVLKDLALEEVDTSVDDTPVVNLINSILLKGYTNGASDIHIEPFEHQTLVRLRIDGQIIEYLNLSPTLHKPLIARTKILSDLDIAEKRLPQDGHFKIKIDGLELNLRVSTLPTIYGEKCVMRYLNNQAKLDFDKQFGMTDENYQIMQRVLNNPNGIIYITGPTGSGKTTTLYMIVERMAQQNVNITTVEDPVERSLPRINQTQVNAQAGLTFAAGLRSILRQDPDIIMIGETRDGETASIAVSAAITGHLVFSTLHTNDAISSISRLIDMGVEEFMVANSVVCVLAQRLAKKICPNCKVQVQSDDAAYHFIGRDFHSMWVGQGCHICNNTGYKGRIAIHEILELDPAIKNMVSKKMGMEHIYEYVRQTGKMKTLRDGMVDLVRQGITTVEELMRLTYVAE